MQLLKSIFIFIVIPLLAFAESQDSKKYKMLSNLEFIKDVFETKYAPAEWKKAHFDWDLNKSMFDAKMKIRTPTDLSLKEYQSILRQFFFSLRDYHSSILFHSTEGAFLPFRIQGINGKYFVSWISASEKFHSYSLSIGDQIIEFDGRDVHDVIQELKSKELGANNPETDQLMAEDVLTDRIAALGHAVPRGTVLLKVLSLDDPEGRYVEVPWCYFPEKITNGLSLTSEVKSYKDLGEHPFYHKKRMAPFYEHLHTARRTADGYAERLRIRKGDLPALGTILSQGSEDDFFYAYIFEIPGNRTIGYIRISDYGGTAQEVADFTRWIKYFEKKTSALVIDQLDNPGGSLLYLYALASMLSKTPLLTFKESVTLTQADIAFCLDYLEVLEEVRTDAEAIDLLGSSLSGYPVDLNLANCFANDCQKMLKEWSMGHFFTSPLYPYGISYIQPSQKACYTKPILVLVNSRSFSCGDYFPALLQDNQRATIFGSRTAGAGGYVLPLQYPNLFGIAEFSVTGSIAVRSNGLPIENLGVTPDIEYQLTENDLQRNYVDYIKAVQEALLHILSQ